MTEQEQGAASTNVVEDGEPAVLTGKESLLCTVWKCPCGFRQITAQGFSSNYHNCQVPNPEMKAVCGAGFSYHDVASAVQKAKERMKRQIERVGENEERGLATAMYILDETFPAVTGGGSE